MGSFSVGDWKRSGNANFLGLMSEWLWDLTKLIACQEDDLPDLMQKTQLDISPRHQKHQSCIASFFNNTMVQQLHKCYDPWTCEKVMFPVDGDSIKKGFGSAWLLYEGFVAIADERYIAISHLWVERIGIGHRKICSINHCLCRYVFQLIKKMAVWRDLMRHDTTPYNFLSPPEGH